MNIESLKHVGLAVVLAVLVISLPAQAEKRKVSGTAREVAQPIRNVPYARENPTREIAQRVAIFNWFSSNTDWDGIVESSPQQNMSAGGNGKDVGHIVFHHKNGDESWGYFTGTHKFIDKGNGAWELPFEGEKVLTGGTGKFANIKGTLKYKGVASPAGSTFTWEGELDY
jgi:hypothetical protein